MKTASLTGFTLLTLLTLLTSVPLYGESISFNHEFSLTSHEEAGGSLSSLLDTRGIESLSEEWNLQPFDTSLGTPLARSIEISFTCEISTNVEAFTPCFLMDPLEGGGSISSYWSIREYSENDPLTLLLQTHSDTHILYDVQNDLSMDISIQGLATLTYYYEPTVIPEPGSVILLSSGLFLLWRRTR